MLKLNYFLADIFILSAEKQPIKLSWRKIECLREEQLKYIQNHSDDIDGLILDLKLDDCLNENKKRATFRGSTLAQEIRSRQKENLIKQMPIILFSANDKVKSSLEKAGIDIFDLFIDKGSVNVTTFNIYSKQLEALSESYKLIDQSKDPQIRNL